MSWQYFAECRYSDPELFFPDRSDPATAAKRICSRCPVMEQCLAEALRNGEEFGVWGNTTERERAEMLPKVEATGGPVDYEHMRELIELGLSRREIARRLQCSEMSVTRFRRGLEESDAS